ncbi:MAG: ABC transporter permease [Variovorax sp.]
MSRNARSLQGAILPLVVLALWQVTASNGTLPSYLASPWAVAKAIYELFGEKELMPAFRASLYRVYTGFAIGAGFGLLVGLAAGTWKPLRHFFDPLVAFLFPIPKIAFLPVFLLLFGLGHGLIVSIISFSVFFPVFLSSRHAVLSVNPLFIWAARNMGTPAHIIFLRVLLPAIAPQAFTGLRVGLSMAFVLLFASELISAHEGLGTLISHGEEAARYDMMLAGILCFAVAGFISDRILMAVRRRVLRGQTVGTIEAMQP